MSNSIVNIRIFGWHFGLRKNWRPFISYNHYHRDAGWPDGYASVYDWFGVI